MEHSMTTFCLTVYDVQFLVYTCTYCLHLVIVRLLIPLLTFNLLKLNSSHIQYFYLCQGLQVLSLCYW